MRIRTLLLSSLVALPLAAAAQSTSEAGVPIPESDKRITTFRHEGQPIILRWGPAERPPNVSDYSVTVADLDRNGNGRIEKSEVPDNHALYFEWHLVDKNKDGHVTDEELRNWN